MGNTIFHEVLCSLNLNHLKILFKKKKKPLNLHYKFSDSESPGNFHSVVRITSTSQNLQGERA